MQITIDSTTVTAEDLAAIAVLCGITEGAEPATPAPARRAAAKKAPAKKAAAAPVEEPEEEEAEEEEDGPTLEDAVARAQELVGEKRTDEVKAALKTLKVERVTKLTGAKIAKFLELVADGEDEDVV